MPKFLFCFLFTLIHLFNQSSKAQNLELKIEGSSESETRIIDSIGYKKSFADYRSLENVVDSTMLKLDKSGYINKEILSFNKLNDSLFLVKLKLNNRYKYVRVFFNNLSERDILFERLAVSDKDYIDIELSKLEETMTFLISEMAKKGDPFYELRLSDFKVINETLLSTTLTSNTNNTRTIDKILIKGYEKFPKSYLKYLIGLKEGQLLDVALITKKSKSIDKLLFSKQTRDPEILFTNDSTLLYIYVEKRKNNAFDGFLGFGTDEETNKLQLDGYLNLQLVNNLNYGERLNIYYKSDESEQKTFDLKLSMPYLFGLPVGIKSQLNIFKKDSSFLTTTQNIALEYRINTSSNISLGYTGIDSDNLIETVSSTINSFNSKFLEVGYNYFDPNIDDALYPTNFMLDVNVGLGNRQSENNKQSQTKAQLETFKIFYLNERNSIFGRLSGGLLYSDNYFENELFRFGGINSIRGFKENSIAANLFAVLNSEYRYRLSSNFYVHSVLDAAYFENEITETREKLFGFGFGFGILTETGLLKFNYSGSRVGNETVKLADFKIHISLNANF